MDEQVRIKLSTEAAMKLAIQEAYKGAPYVSPNPLVGCVILDSEGYLLKTGYHKKYGGPHAEVNALEGLTNEQLKNAHVIVTLEPCAHEGKTPSCAKALAKLPIKKVTFGLVDPNPLVAGQGADILRKVGIEADEFVGLKEELEDVCEAFLMNFRAKKIFVALKVATSLDGQMALKTGESQWITGEKARQKAHYLRACYDGILVGAGTVKHDNPTLNIRHPEIKKHNKVVVLDPSAGLLKSYKDLNMAKAHRAENVFWCVSENTALPDLLVQPQILKIKMNGDQFDFDHLMEELWKTGVRSLFVEGGAFTFSQFIKAGYAHRIYNFVAPHLIGAGGGLSWTKFLEIPEMKNRWPLQSLKVEPVGDDLLISTKFRTKV